MNCHINGKVILPYSVVVVMVVFVCVVVVAVVNDFHTALNPVPVTDASVCILTVMVGPVLVKGLGMELPQNFSL